MTTKLLSEEWAQFRELHESECFVLMYCDPWRPLAR